MKKSLFLITTLFLNLFIFSQTLERQLKDRLTGRWLLIKIKIENKYKSPPKNYRYRLTFYSNNEVHIYESMLNNRNNSSSILEKGKYKIERKKLFIKIPNIKLKKYRIYSVGKKRLILRIPGNSRVKYLYYFFERI